MIANLGVISDDSRRNFQKKIEEMDKESMKRKEGREVNLNLIK